MAITRAQIPEQIDVFQEGGIANLEDYQTVYDSISNPITIEEIDQEAEVLRQLLNQPQRSNIFDLATNLSRGLTAQAMSGQPPSIGLGLAAGFNSFNEALQKKKSEAEKLKQDIRLKAYEQVQARNKELRELTQDVIEKSLEAGFEGFGSSERGRALSFIVRAMKNPELKNTPEYAIALEVAKGQKIVQTEEGSIVVPGINIDKIVGGEQAPPPNTKEVDEIIYTLVPNEFDKATGKPIYQNPDGKKGVLP